MSFGRIEDHGSKLFTADAIVGGVAKRPVRVFSATWLSDGTARSLVLRSGSTDSDTAVVTIAGTSSVTITQNWEGGLLFPDGCFLDYTASMVNVVLEYRTEVD